MKLQDVLLKAMAKKITWWDTAEVIGVSDRTMRQWRERRTRQPSRFNYFGNVRLGPIPPPRMKLCGPGSTRGNRPASPESA